MGILAGFIGGAARATGQIADQRIARYTAEEIQRQRDLMDQERERRIEEAQIAREGRAVAQREKDRTDMTSRVDKEAGLIADAAISAKRGLIDQGIVDRNSWTPEQQKVVDDALAAERQSIASDIDTKYKASVNTGDTSLQNAALMDKQERRLDQQDKKNDEQTKFNNRRLDMQDEWQKKQDNIRNKMLQLQEERAKRSEDKFDDQQSKAELNSTRLSLQSVLKDIATQEDKLQVQLASPTIDPEQQKIMIRKMEELDALRVESRNYLLDLAGVKKDKAAPPVDPLAADFAALAKGKNSAANTPPPSTSAAPIVQAPAPKETKPTAAAPQQSARAYDGGLNLRPLIESISSRVSSNRSARDVENMTRLIQAKNRARIELTPEEQAFAKENKIY
jgi:hypothetical protein